MTTNFILPILLIISVYFIIKLLYSKIKNKKALGIFKLSVVGVYLLYLLIDLLAISQTPNYILLFIFSYIGYYIYKNEIAPVPSK